MKTILLTGAAGGVGTMIRPLLREHYRLRLSDRAPVRSLATGEDEIPAELTDLGAVKKAVDGVDGIIHLGGQPVEASFEVILNSNIIGAYNLFEAARQQGVRRVVFASTNHAVGFYRRDEVISDGALPRPDTRYGMSKAYGEALGALYAYKYGFSVLSIRIGNIAARPMDERRLAIWQSPRDFAQLARIGLEHPDIRHEIVYGMSDNKRAWWDNSNAHRLGYRPVDRAEDYAAEVLATATPPSDPRELLYQGGPFVLAEGDGGAAPKT